jgi:hypothetical protein
MLTSDLLAALAGTAGAGSRVYALHVPQKDATYPAVVYQVISDSPTTSLVGSRKPDRVRVQVDAWAATYAAARSLHAEVRTKMEAAAYQGMLADVRDDFEPEAGLYRVSADFFCWEQ